MIGIFDSGVGGLTVAKAIEQFLPKHSLLYFGDTARTPYGTKSKKVITEYSLRNADFLLGKGAKILVIGCNSASSVATEVLRERFDVPIFEVIGPAAQKAIEITKSGNIGIIGTNATIRSGIYEKTITDLNRSCTVHSIPCPLLVPLVEEGWLNKRETKMIIRRYLHSFKPKQIDALILGCTHYPLLKNLIQARVGRKTTLIDSSVETAKALSDFLQKEGNSLPKEEKVQHQFYFSDITESAQKTAKMVFGRPMELLSS